MANNILAKMAVQISANTAEFNKALQKTNKEISSFTGGITKVAGVLGVAFGVQQIASFALEISKLAGEAEGVSAAFNRLENSRQLLLDLKEATRGTVSELTLMKRAVQFSNFGLELSKLPTLLEFATRRAQQTGQSVDYLVDSIVTGLGRKSVLILDNLGISAIQLREEMAKVGDITVAVSNIIERDVAGSAPIIETVALRTEQLAANWENYKVSIGRAANDTGILGTVLEGLNETLIVLASETLNAGQKIAFFAGNSAQRAAILMEAYAREVAAANEQTKKTESIQRQAALAFKEFNGNLENYKKVISNHVDEKELIKEFEKLTEQTKKLSDLEGTLSGAIEEQNYWQKAKLTLRGKELAQANIRLEQLAEEIRLLNQLGLVQKKTLTPPKTTRPTPTTNTGNLSGAQLFPVIPNLEESFNSAAGFLGKFTEEYKAFAEEIGEMSFFIAGGITEIADAFGESLVGDGGVKAFGRGILRSLAGFGKQFGAMLIKIGIGNIALGLKQKGAQQIAAGIGLVAASSAIGAASSGGGSYGRGGGSLGRGTAASSGGVTGIGNISTPIELSGDFRISGYALETVLDKQTYKKNRIGG